MIDSSDVRIILLLLLLCLTTGCSKRVDYAVKNVSQETLDEVGVFFNDDHSMLHGILISGAHKGFGGAFKVLSENKVRIIWNDSDSKEHTVELTVSGDDLRDSRSIMFAIDDDMQVTTQWRFDR